MSGVAAAIAIAAITACSKPSRPLADDAATAAPAASARSDAAPIREVVMLRRVRVDVVAPAGGHRPDDGALGARLGRLGPGVVADASGVPAGWAGRGGALDAVVTYDLGGSDRTPLVLMTIEATLELDGGALGAAARAAGERPVGASRAGAVDGLATQLVEQVATELTAKLTLRAAPAGALVDAAASEDAETVAWALELAAERGDPALRPVAIDALAKPARLRSAALQYLVALREPSAVAALTGSVDFADPEGLAATIEAVTAIGGDDARAFLEMLAAGATDLDLRRRARDGLERLARRQDAAP